MKGLIAGAASVAGVTWLMSRPAARALGETIGRMAGGDGNRWLVVTVNCPPNQIAGDGGQLPAPIGKLDGRVEVRVQPAPGNRGTELGLRLTEPPPEGLAGLPARLQGTDPRQEVRSVLRDAKSLIETGEVIRPDEPGTTHPTATGKLLDLALRVAGGEGRL